MPKLDDNVRRFIVQALACYDTPTQVADAVKEEFGLALGRQQCASYDPTKAGCKGIAKKWVDLFNTTRAKFLDDAASIPIAQQSFRLRALQSLLEQARRQKNAPLAAQLLEQAAKEVGGSYLDKRRVEVSAPGGGPVQHQHTHLHEMTDADLERIASTGRGGA